MLQMERTGLQHMQPSFLQGTGKKKHFSNVLIEPILILSLFEYMKVYIALRSHIIHWVKCWKEHLMV